MNTPYNQVYPFKLPTTEYPNFPERLKYTMSLRNCSVAELAESAYVSRSTICGYRKGSRCPDIRTLRLLCVALNVSSDFLIGLREDIYL